MAGGKGDGGEVVLQTAWLRRFYRSLTFYHIEVETGEVHPRVEVLDTGEGNPDGGPNFFNARLRIGSYVWVGNVEVHRKASEWIRHKHHLDPAYDSTILHVVLDNDIPILSRLAGTPLFTCVMDLDTLDLKRAQAYLENKGTCACADRIRGSLPLSWESWSRSLFDQRIKSKAQRLISLYEALGRDKASVLHQLFMRYMGSRVNNEAFEQVARSLPLRVVRKHTDSLPMLEALYLGQASLLTESIREDYYVDLQERYRFLKTKFSLEPIPPGVIRLLRLRPSSFPHRRLAHMASLRYHYPLFESELAQVAGCSDLRKILQVPLSEYWQHHYTFRAQGERSLGTLSLGTVDSLYLNTLLPLPILDAYALGEVCTDALLEQIWQRASSVKAEKNSIVSKFVAMGFPVKDATHSQAVLELWQTLCSHRSCSLCSLGQKVFSHPISL